MKRSKIELVLEIGSIDRRSMALMICNSSGTIFSKNSFDESQFRISFDVEFPDQLIFHTSNKNINDTIVGPNGSIEKDMYIKIVKFSIDGLSIKTWILEQKLFSGESASGDLYHTNYLGYNGKTTVDLGFTDSFRFFLDLLTVDR